jgi:hypothetical protein
MFALSSVARLRIFTVAGELGVNVYDHDSRPVARCQVAPSSVETSTPPTRPPPPSVAAPDTVTGLPTGRFAFAAGAVIVDVGAAVSVDGVAAVSPDWSVAGCTPMSARRFTVAC